MSTGPTPAVPPGPAERYRAFADLARFPLGGNADLVYAPLTRAAQVLSASSVQLLQNCPMVATLEEHARRLCRDFNLDPGQAEPIRQHLAFLAQAGYLVSAAELAGVCRRATAPGTPSLRIAALGIPTRNRPQDLQHCLASYVESGLRYGRTHEYVIVDDSADPGMRAANRDMLRALRARHGVPVGYAGPEEKAAFAAALVRHADLPPEAVQFGLLNPEQCPVTTGGSRNALLLHTAGDLLLQVDDDTRCCLTPAPGARDGLALSAQFDPTEFWFAAPGDPALPCGPLEEADLLAVHEQLLGKSLGACVAPWADGDLDLNSASAAFFRKLLPEGGRVLVTAAGVAGDSGMGTPVYFLSLDGPSRVRLLQSEAGYRHALTHQQIARAVLRATICDGAVCMALNLGLDNRQLLPPFLPVQRNQDGVFAALVRSCVSSGYFGFLPWMVFHRSATPRLFAESELWQAAAGLRTGQIIQALVRAAAPLPGPTTAVRSLPELGRTLAEWGTLPAADFEELVHLQLWGQLSRLAQHLDGQLRKHGGQPGFWAQDVSRFLTCLREGLVREDYGVPLDLAEAFGTKAGRALLQRLVFRFGQLLQVWPDMVRAARELRAQGIRLAAPVRCI